MVDFFFFFFSSRRRHTRCSRDWSSDVCSSDLLPIVVVHCNAERPIRPAISLPLVKILTFRFAARIWAASANVLSSNRLRASRGIPTRERVESPAQGGSVTNNRRPAGWHVHRAMPGHRQSGSALPELTTKSRLRGGQYASHQTGSRCSWFHLLWNERFRRVCPCGRCGYHERRGHYRRSDLGCCYRRPKRRSRRTDRRTISRD